MLGTKRELRIFEDGGFWDIAPWRELLRREAGAVGLQPYQAQEGWFATDYVRSMSTMNHVMVYVSNGVFDAG